MIAILFILFAGLAVGCAVALVAQRNPLYSAISLVGVFVALACIYLTLAAPFIAAVQVIVYAGAIMVLVIFVIMLLNVEEEVRRPIRLAYLIPVGVGLAAVLIAEAAFMLALRGGETGVEPPGPGATDIGSTTSIGTGLFTEYLLPFEVTSILLLMALVGAITLARRASEAGGAHGDFGLGPRRGVASAPAASGVIQPGHTAATGQAFAEYQIGSGEAAAPTGEKRGEENV